MTSLVSRNFISLPNGQSASGNAMSSLEFDVVGQDVVQVDVSDGQPGQSLSRVESLYVDNTRGSGILFFVFSDTSRLIIVPQGAEGCYPTYSNATYFRVAQSGSKKGIHARVKAFACLKMYYERFPGAGGLLQNPLDVNNGPNGLAPVVLPSGWDTSYASPNVVISGPRITFPNGGPVMVPWASLRDVTDGILYFEITNESTSNTGPGIASATEPYLTTPPGRLYVGTQNKTANLYQGFLQTGDVRLANSSVATANTTLAFCVDFGNKGVIVTVNGTPMAVQPGQQGSKPGEATLALFDFPMKPVVVVDNTTYAAPGASYLMTSLPPFKFANNLPIGTSPWDNPGGPMV